jgi:uncharacterized protein YoaH (UPF0181 family)
VAAPLLITLGARALGSSVPPATTLFVTLLVVVLGALLGGARPALAAIAVGLVAQEVLFSFPYGSLTNHKPAQISVLVAFVAIGAGIGILVDELARLTSEQAALKRIATLVARGVPPAELFAAVAEEVASRQRPRRQPRGRRRRNHPRPRRRSPRRVRRGRAPAGRAPDGAGHRRADRSAGSHR